jgi:hypothetical protein
MRKSASMLQFSEHAINQVQGLKNRGLDLPVTPRLQRRRYRCALEIVFLCLYLGNWKSERYPFEALFARIPRLDNRNTNNASLLLLFTRNKHRGIFCMSFILSVLFYLYISAIVAAHNRHRRVLPYIGSETKHIVKEGEGFFSRLVFRRSSSKHHHGLDEVVHVPSSSSSSSHRSHHEDMELELEDEDSNVARMFYHH